MNFKISDKIEYQNPYLFLNNNLNYKYFRSIKLSDAFLNDIEKNGIRIPVITKRDGKTILSGHKRIKAAKIKNIDRVPYQRLENEISESEEIKFIISDNLYRVHLSKNERISLYLSLYPEFYLLFNDGYNRKEKRKIIIKLSQLLSISERSIYRYIESNKNNDIDFSLKKIETSAREINSKISKISNRKKLLQEEIRSLNSEIKKLRELKKKVGPSRKGTESR